MKVKARPMVNCAVYTRLCATDPEAGRKSHRERDACRAFVASQREHGWRALPTRYIDTARSGSTMQRPSLRRLIEGVRKGIVRVVVVYQLEHLSANLSELAKIIEVLDQHEVSLVSLSQQLNTSEPAGRVAVRLLLSFDRFESTQPEPDPPAKVAPVTPPKVSPCGSKPAEYEKFLQNSQAASSESRHTIRVKFLVLGPERKTAFLSWARKGFRVRKPTARQRQTADSAKTA